MHILIFDEDPKHLPILCDLLRQKGHTVLQVKDQQELEKSINVFKPEGIVIDLMMPSLNCPPDMCSGGYTTGGYIYRNIINKIAPGIPFIVYTATVVEVSFINKEIQELKKFKEYRWVLEKGCNEELIVQYLTQPITGG